ncbi:MAG: hypothetical protein ACP5FX_01840 [Candidatus Micrarchaeia archaeon]
MLIFLKKKNKIIRMIIVLINEAFFIPNRKERKKHNQEKIKKPSGNEKTILSNFVSHQPKIKVNR